MTKKNPSALFVGNEKIGKAIAAMNPSWDFKGSIPSIAQLWSGLGDGTIDSEVQILLVHDAFFDPNGENKEFENLINSMAPYCFLGIINYTPENNDMIRERIEAEAYATSNSGQIQYYFISKTQAKKDLDEAISLYLRTTDNTETADIISGNTSTEDFNKKRKEDEEERQSEFNVSKENVNNSGTLGQIVVVTSSKGGSGKSTVAITLANYMAVSSVESVKMKREKEKLKILLVDLDVRDGQLGFITNNYSPTMLNIHKGNMSEQSIDDTIIKNNRLGIDLLLAPKFGRHANDLPPEFFVELLQNLKSRYDYIILDTSVNYLDPLLEKVAYPMADQIVFVTDIVINSIFSMTRWIRETTGPREKQGMGISRNKIGIVVNKSLAGVNSDDKIKQAVSGLPIITVVPSQPKLAALAANTQSMDMLLQHGAFKEAIAKLARAITGQKYKLTPIP